MNKERRAHVQVLANICGAFRGDPPPKVLMVLRDAVRDVHLTEQRSARRMEAYKDNESTAKNYEHAVACAEDLRLAMEELEEGELEHAARLLTRVAADPDEEPVQPQPKKRRK